MAIIDPEAAQVALDRAMSVGLMGYPPILGKRVTVHLPSMLCESSSMRDPDVRSGVVESVGPLGFVVGSIMCSVMEDDGSLRTVGIPGHMFCPWSTCVSWLDDETTHPQAAGRL